MLSDIEIARAAKLKPIAEIAARIGIPASALCPYGPSIAKLDPSFLESLADRRLCEEAQMHGQGLKQQLAASAVLRHGDFPSCALIGRSNRTKWKARTILTRRNIREPDPSRYPLS